MFESDWDLSVARVIKELRARSKLSRTIYEGVLCSPSGERFFVRRITDPQDWALVQAHDLIRQNFSLEETDPFEVFSAGASDEGNGYFVVQNEKRGVLSLANVRYFPMRQRDGGSIGQGVLFVAYIVTRQDARELGFAGELYQTFYQWARDYAHVAGHNFWGVIGETVEEVERFLNKMGRKRVYFEDAAGNVHEVPYQLPPLNWDPKTGTPTSNFRTEHLMVWCTDEKQRFPVAELLDVVEALYEETYPPGREFFESDEAHQAARRVVQGIFAKLEEALARDAQGGEVFLMSKSERAERTKA